VSWQAVALPVKIDNLSIALTEDLKLYALSQVQLGGNWRLVECDLTATPPICTARDTGVAVPSTDGHYNLRDVLVEGDYIYVCYARWTGLICYRFSRMTGAGSSYGSVNPAGHSDLNYHHMVKIKEDVYYMKARTGDGRQWTLFKFKGSTSQITDSAQWEKVGTIIDDTPIAPSGCGDGSIQFSYCTFIWPAHERYLLFACYNRCPSPATEIGNFSVFIFDTLKEKLLAPDFSEIPFGVNTLYSATKITFTEGKPTGTIYRGDPQIMVFDMARRKAYGDMGWSLPTGYIKGIADIDLSTRTAKFIQRPADLRVHAITTDGKAIVTETNAVRLYDPSTGSISDVLSVPGLEPGLEQVCLHTEDVFRRVETIIPAFTHIILPPNWQDGLKVPKRVTVSSPGAGQLRVQAQFQLAPSNIRVRLWKIPDLTIVNEETLAGTTSIDRTYSVAGGRYRVEVTAL
jgi:hypothetical protein